MSLKTCLYQLLSLNKTILISNSTTPKNIPDNETSPYISEENENEGYLYLLVIDLLIFCSLTYTTYNSSKNAELNEARLVKSEKEDSSLQFFLYLIKWLVIANALRSLSLISYFYNYNKQS